MASTTSCLRGPELLRFVLGQLSPAEASSLEQHLAQCRHCRAALTALREPETISEVVRANGMVGELLSTLLDDLRQRVEHLLPPDAEPADQTSATQPSLPPNEQPTVDYCQDTGTNRDPSKASTASAPSPGGSSPGRNGGLTTHTSPNLPVPPVKAPHPAGIPGYEILDILGRGGMGVVYKARQLRLNRLVALKMILGGDHAGPEDLARFRDEAEAIARLQHPHIVQIYEVGEHDGRPYFSLEFASGGSLTRRVHGQPQEARATAQCVAMLARAVHYAHQRGVVHRDLKPGNVLLAPNPHAAPHSSKTNSGLAFQAQETKTPMMGGSATPKGASSATPALGNSPFDVVSDLAFRIGDFVPKVADFGLAKLLDHSAGYTETGQVVGTPSYMAPEQARGRREAMGPAIDIYALGAILYDMLTGRPPFTAVTSIETVMKVINEEPLPPSRLQAGIPRDLETICLKCLQKDPRKRYDTAEALAEDLQHFLEGEPIQARPVPAWERGVKWARRRPARAGLIAVSAAVVILLAALGWVAAEFYRQRGESAQQELDAVQRREALRTEVQRAVDQGQEAYAAGNWQQAQLAFQTALDKAATEPAFAEVKGEAARLLAQTQERLADVETRRAARARYDDFIARHNEVLFHESQFTGLDREANHDATRTAARKALVLFGLTPEAPAKLALDPAHFSDAERRDIAARCYELFLILATAVAQPAKSGERPSEAQVTEALRTLDRAAELRAPTRAYHLRRARFLTDLGQKAAAEQAGREALALKPDDAVDYFLLGDERLREGDVAAAISYFKDALRLQPDHFWAHYLLAVCYLRSQLPDQAAQSLSVCQGLQSRFVWVYLLRGLAYAELGRRALDARRQEEANEQFSRADADFRRAAELKPDEDAAYTLTVNRGTLRYRQGRLAEAMQDFQDAVRQRPKAFQAYTNLAQASQDLARTFLEQDKRPEANAQLDQAVAQLSQAIALKPQMAALYRNRAYVHLLRNDLPAALRDFDTTVALEAPGSAFLAADHTERGRMLQEQQQPAEALQAYDAALQVDADNPAAHRYRAAVLMELKRYPEAVRAFDAYLKKGKPAVEIFEARALARMRTKDYAGAIADYSRALEIRPRSDLYARRGWVYVIAEAPRPALRDFEEALRLDPKNADAFNGRGYARVKLGFLTEGTADAEEAVRQAPANSRMIYGAARVYAQAVGKIDADAGSQDRSLRQARGRYQSRAVELIGQALALLPAGERAAFWRDSVQTDLALAPIVRSSEFQHLAASYVKPP